MIVTTRAMAAPQIPTTSTPRPREPTSNALAVASTTACNAESGTTTHLPAPPLLASHACPTANRAPHIPLLRALHGTLDTTEKTLQVRLLRTSHLI